METTSFFQQGRADSSGATTVPSGIWLSYLVYHRSALFALLLVATVFAIDLWLPLGVASAVPYTFAVLLALKARWRTFPVQVAVLCCVLTVAKMFLSPERGSTELWKVYANRGLAVFSITVTTFLGLQRRRSDEERQHAEEQTRLHLADLAHMGRLKTAGELATGLAHELNQPLTAISLQADVATSLAQNRAPLDDLGLRTALQEVSEQSQRAAAIVRALRGMVQKAEPKRAPVNLNDIVREVVRLTDSQAERAGVALHVHLADVVPSVLGDRIQLGQVLFNLLQNAIDATAEVRAGAVQVRTTLEHGKCVTISVCDNGEGLTPSDLERVFERFYSTKPTGMGMGLAISRSIVEAHGGRLWADTNPPRGAVFTLSLPLAPGEMP